MAAKVWVVLQQREGRLHRMAREAAEAAGKLANLVGHDSVDAVLLGHGLEAIVEQASEKAFGTVHVADAEVLSEYTPGAYCAVLEQALRTHEPEYVVFPHTYQTVDFMARLAQSVNGTLVPEVTAVESVDGALQFQRPAFEGKLQATVRVQGDFPILVSVQSGAFSADGVAEGTASVATLDVDGVTRDREILGVEEVGGEQVDLSAAEVVVAVGRGIGDQDNLALIEKLAGVLGAEIGASRPVIDNGWLPRDRQIGSSGQTVAPKLYLAAGISGAIQHLVGMKGSQTVVAINKDAGAPIFAVADYGLVGDLHEIVPALVTALEEAKGG